jgi:NhaP-type Na+/H+ or K+/H+ antiporter
MNTAIWIIQGVLAALFLMHAIMVLISSKQKPDDKKPSVLQMRIIAFLELLGVIGIIIPYLTGILPILTPFAAIGFSVVMVGAFVVHYKKMEYKILPLLVLLFVLSLVVAYYRF